MTKEAKQPIAAELAEQWRYQAGVYRQKADQPPVGYPEASNENWRKFHLEQAEAAERTAERFEKEAEK